MEISNRLQNIAVIGAAGKMGSGILYTATLYIAQLALAAENQNKTYCIFAIDKSHQQINQ
jgi:3-hydroxyacyl-CoA dehydrogenase